MANVVDFSLEQMAYSCSKGYPRQLSGKWLQIKGVQRIS
jgi:hypothetical protein